MALPQRRLEQPQRRFGLTAAVQRSGAVDLGLRAVVGEALLGREREGRLGLRRQALRVPAQVEQR